MASKKHLPDSKVIALRKRNPLYNHPLLSKSVVHKKSNKAVRRNEKIAIKKEWLPQNIFIRVLFGETALVIANK